MKQKRTILIGILCTAILAACTKHPGDIEEPVPTATITFASPTAGAVYKPGDSIRIQGVVLASAVMHGYDVSVKNAADTSVVYFAEHIHDHNDTLHINQAWKNTLNIATDLQVDVTVTLDHDGHTSSKTVGVKTAAN